MRSDVTDTVPAPYSQVGLAVTAVANGSTNVHVSFSSMLADPLGMLDFTGSWMRMPKSGMYRVSWQLVWAQPGALTDTIAFVGINGSGSNIILTDSRRMPANGSLIVPNVGGSGLARLSVGDYLHVGAQQNSGASMNTAGGSLSAEWIGR